MPDPIMPTRIIPAGEKLPAPAGPPSTPLPPPPPQPPAAVPPPPPGGWWPAEPAPVPVAVYVDVHLVPAEPEAPAPGIRWWQTWRPLYNTCCAIAGLPLAGKWADLLGLARDEAGLAAAWVIALVPLGIVAMLDNIHSVAAANAAPALRLPRLKAAAWRAALWALLIGTTVALPVVTVVYVVTGVRS